MVYDDTNNDIFDIRFKIAAQLAVALVIFRWIIKYIPLYDKGWINLSP